MPTSLYLDESKAKGYLLAVAVLPDERATETRATLRGLVMAGQRRIHFAKESDRRRRAILAELAKLRIGTRVYRANGQRELPARKACLEAALTDPSLLDADRIVLELDPSIERHDDRVLDAVLRAQGRLARVSFTHRLPASEPLLWIPDAVAWCVARGGEWRRRAEPLLDSIRDIRP